MARSAAMIGLAALVAGLWLLYGLSGDYRIFGGMSTAQALRWAAWFATALLLVAVIARFVFGVGFALLDREATGVQRGIIYSVLTFVIVSLLLGSFGINIGAIFTTSVVAAAIVGLAMQPTLGGLIAGSALQLDRALRVGDVILLDDEKIEVVSLNWRSVVGRKHGSTVVIIPNARIAERELDILRAGQPARVDVSVPAPLTVAPHRMSEVLSGAIHDLPYVDSALPVRVTPSDFHTLDGHLVYRVQYWIRHNYDLSRARAALLSRVWYLYQREQIPWHLPTDFVDTPGLARLPATDPLKGLRLDRLADANLLGLEAAVLAAGLSPDIMGAVIADCGPPLCYADDELLTVPLRAEEYSLFLLVEGAVRDAPLDAARADAALERGMHLATHSNRRMAIERIAARLAEHIGPYAKHAVREAAAADPDPMVVGAAVAGEIDDPEAREGFLRSLHLDHEVTRKPGLVFGLQQGAYSRVSSPPLRAVGGAIVVPIVLESRSPAAPAKQQGA